MLTGIVQQLKLRLYFSQNQLVAMTIFGYFPGCILKHLQNSALYKQLQGHMGINKRKPKESKLQKN
jgi:hypothetical protein